MEDVKALTAEEVKKIKEVLDLVSVKYSDDMKLYEALKVIVVRAETALAFLKEKPACYGVSKYEKQ
ncbi:hypothetical protein [Candidatus Endomicrobiellum agilis]|uniref:hypothetical protein n=1 Tax=Candidatus Endomicrobiellum agilis TaxID=3238957 RepID=UPI00357CF356|nr:hypothetical protein [Endomicrobium sp.]